MLHERIVKAVENEINNSFIDYKSYNDLFMIELYPDEIEKVFVKKPPQIIIPNELPKPKTELRFCESLFHAEIEGYVYYDKLRDRYRLTDKGVFEVSYLIL